MRRPFQFLLFIFPLLNVSAQKQVVFRSLDSLLEFAEKRSAITKISQQQSLLAKWTKITAVGNTVNLKSPFTANWTNNTQLPVSYLPGQVFGGPAGTYKEVQIGQQYVSNYSLSPQIDLVNPSSWARVRSAAINEQLTETNNKLARKNLFESIAAAYFNIVSMQQQMKQLDQNIASADSVERIVWNRWKQGIVREQEVNNATINALLVKDKRIQAELVMEQNYNGLRILCDLQAEEELRVVDPGAAVVVSSVKAEKTMLLEEQFRLQESLNESELRANRLQSFSPTLSLVFNQAWQQNSNDGFFSSNSFRFNSNYVGLRLSVPFPLDANRLSQNFTSKIATSISGINSRHSQIQSQVNRNQLDIDYEKALSAFETAEKIQALKSINYQKSRNQYDQGILPTDLLLSAFTEAVNAEINAISAQASLRYAAARIAIHNSIP